MDSVAKSLKAFAHMCSNLIPERWGELAVNGNTADKFVAAGFLGRDSCDALYLTSKGCEVYAGMNLPEFLDSKSLVSLV